MAEIVKPLSTLITAANVHLYKRGGVYEGQGYGCVPRDMQQCPLGYLGRIAEPFNMPLFDESEIEDRIRQQEKDQSSLEHISERSGPNGGPIPSLDQNGQGFCWFYSTTMAVMLVRAAMGLPYKRLSGHAACLVTGYQDHGWWCTKSLEFASQKGIPSVETWQEKSMAKSNETSAMWADAASNIVTEWWDVDASDRNTLRRIQATLLLSNVPMMGDRNRWSHSTVDVRLTGWKPFRVRGRNSWTDNWGKRGWFDMEDSMADVDGTAAPRVIMAA